MRVIFFLVGGALGVLLVRGVFLDHLEIMGWKMFWGGVSKGNLLNMDRVLDSTAFYKCSAGFVLAGLVGYTLSGLFIKKEVRRPLTAGPAKKANAEGKPEPSDGSDK